MSKLLKISICCLFFGLITACGGGGHDAEEENHDAGEACTWLGMVPKIVNGAECRDNRSPVVRIDLHFSYGRTAGCSGSLISPDTVLTASHCLNDPALSAVDVVFGNGVKKVSAKEVYYIPSYNNHTGANDVGIVKLTENVSWATIPVLVSRTVQAGETGTIFGYGTTGGSSNAGVNNLRAGFAHVTSANDDSIYMSYKYDSNTCQGDSGGPLVVHHNGVPVVAGVTSLGTLEGCGYGDNSYFAAIRGVYDEIKPYASNANFM